MESRSFPGKVVEVVAKGVGGVIGLAFVLVVLAINLFGGYLLFWVVFLLRRTTPA